MISLKDACQKVLSNHPDEYIHIVNEYDGIYEFVLLKKGERITETTGLLFAPIVNKQTGEIIEGFLLGEYTFGNEILKQHTHSQLERL